MVSECIVDGFEVADVAHQDYRRIVPAAGRCQHCDGSFLGSASVSCSGGLLLVDQTADHSAKFLMLRTRFTQAQELA